MANGLQVRDMGSAATIRTFRGHSSARRSAFNSEFGEKGMDNLKIDFSNDTTLHGLRNACKKGSNVMRRALWVVVLIIMTIGCVVMMTQSTMKYLRFDSVTSTSKLTNSTLQLPAITVCNLNIYKDSVIFEKYPMIYTYQLLESKGVENLTPEELLTMQQITEQLKDIPLKPFMEDVSYTAEEMFVDCHFPYATEDKPCSHYLRPLFNNRGKCYTFHSKDYIKENEAIDVVQPGPSYGVIMTLNTLKEEYYYTFGLGYGLQVLVHDPNVYPLMEQKSFVVSPGQETYVAIQKYMTERLPKPYSPVDCVDTSLPGNDDYSHERCFLDCLGEEYYKGECVYSSYGEITCSLLQVYESVGLLQNMGDIAQKCQKCLPTCTETFYQYRLSTTQFPNKLTPAHSLRYGWNQTNMTYIEENYAHVKIYFDTMEFVTNKQMKSVTLAQMVADIGGQLGICLGASLITLAEFLDYSMIGFYMLYKRCKKSPTKVIEIKPSHQLY